MNLFNSEYVQILRKTAMKYFVEFNKSEFFIDYIVIISPLKKNSHKIIK